MHNISLKTLQLTMLSVIWWPSCLCLSWLKDSWSCYVDKYETYATSFVHWHGFIMMAFPFHLHLAAMQSQKLYMVMYTSPVHYMLSSLYISNNPYTYHTHYIVSIYCTVYKEKHTNRHIWWCKVGAIKSYEMWAYALLGTPTCWFLSHTDHWWHTELLVRIWAPW